MKKNFSFKKAIFLIGLMSLIFPIYGVQAEDMMNQVGLKYKFGKGSFEDEKDTDEDNSKHKVSVSPIGHNVKLYYHGGMGDHHFKVGLGWLFEGSKIEEKIGAADMAELKEEYARNEVALKIAYYGKHAFSEEFKLIFGFMADPYIFELEKHGLTSVRIADIFNLSPYGQASPSFTPYLGLSFQAGPGNLMFKVAFQYHFFQDTEVKLFEKDSKKYLSEDQEGTEYNEAAYEISGGDPIIAKLAYGVKLGEMFKIKPYAYYSYIVLPREAQFKSTSSASGAQEIKGWNVEELKGQTIGLGLKASYMINENFKVAVGGNYNIIDSFSYKQKDTESDAASKDYEGSRANSFSIGGKVSFAF